ncbi:hypothetical protein HQ590_08265 [bacterium]|nr:hypothetical protein [bacterium]
MTSRQRLMATLRGDPVDRPAVNFYEIGGISRDPSVYGTGGAAMDPNDPDPFNVYSDPSWRPLLELAENHTDLIRLRHPAAREPAGSPRGELFKVTEWADDQSRYSQTEIRVGGRTLTQLNRRDRDIATSWCLEHLLKSTDDVRAYLQLPPAVFVTEPDVSALLAEEPKLGERGIIMVDTADPICAVAPLFSMEEFTVFAFTETELCHRLLEQAAAPLYAFTEQVARAFPGHLWRIYGPEYAGEPFLPTRLFEEYVVRYTKPMIDILHRHGSYARVHSHGRIRNLLPHFLAMGADGLDPVEPPPQGDIELDVVRRECGQQLVLFGNLEVSEIETLEPDRFEQRVAAALRDGTTGPGRGFVLMPSSCPCGRTVTPRVLANYETMVRLTHQFRR